MTSTILEGGTNPIIKFYTKVWKPSSNIPIIASICHIHGFIEHIERYNHVFESFASKGIVTFAFDQRGFGQTSFLTKSQGVTNWNLALGDISHFVEYTKSLYPDLPLFLFGHSMGGGLSLAFATRSPPSKSLELIKGIIVTGPLLRQAPAVKTPALVVSVGSILGRIAPSLTMKTVVNPSDVCRDPAVQKAYASDPYCTPIGTFKGVTDMLIGGEKLMKKDYKNWPEKGLPLLLLHGSGDKVTSCDASREFVELLKKEGREGVEFREFDGFYHELVQEPGEDKDLVIAAVADWIKVETNKLNLNTPTLAKI